MFWIVCGLLCAYFILQFARNVRFADTKARAQYYALGERVIGPLSATESDLVSAPWWVFIEPIAASAELLTVLCAAGATHVDSFATRIVILREPISSKGTSCIARLAIRATPVIRQYPAKRALRCVEAISP